MAADTANHWQHPADAPTTLRVIGSQFVCVNGAEVVVSARRQRAVLSYLATAGEEPVSADRILDAVWGDDVPATGARAVAFHISRLRTLLDDDRELSSSLIETSAGGYRLSMERDSIDLHSFHDSIERARLDLRQDAQLCERRLVDALALWRGRPFADLGDEPFVEHETRRLERARMVGLRTLAEARMELGRHVDVVADLFELVDAEPLDEGLVRLLMVALQRSNRAAEGLRVYGELRIRLGNELGIEPSPDVQRLHHQLLDGESDGPEEIVTPGDGETLSRIPAAITSFVGRRDEIDAVAALLDTSRVVTLSGFGGLGKSRLALETARVAAGRFGDGVRFVDLTLATAPTDLADTVLAATGCPASAEHDSIADLVRTLGTLDVLLLLDSCDHVRVGVADLVATMCSASPGLRVLATSREPLGVVGESVWAMGPLAESEAIELFRDRSRSAAQTSDVEVEIDELRRLCARLDGIPLAIELAASRTSVMTIQQIERHLAANDDGTPTVHPDLHRSLDSVIDSSLALLHESDVALLARLSVCASDLDFDAALALAGGDFDDVVHGLQRLVDRSLVVAVDGQASSRRFRILNAVGSSAQGRCGAGVVGDAEQRHAEHYAAVAATIFDLWVDDPDAMVRLGDVEVGNLRAAMTWAYENDRVELGLAITRGARMYFWSRRMHRENIRWMLAGIERALAQAPGVTPVARDVVLDAAAIVLIEAHNVGDRKAIDTVLPLVEDGIDRVDDPMLRGNLLSALGAHLEASDPVAADRMHVESFRLRRQLGVRALPSLANRIEASWISGVLDLDDVRAGLVEVMASLDVAPAIVTKIEAGIEARAGRWSEVLRLARAMPRPDAATEVSVQLLTAEALIGLGRHGDAEKVLGDLVLEVDGRQRVVSDLLWASLELGRGVEPARAAERLAGLMAACRTSTRALPVAMPTSALAGVASCRLGDVESANLLFGFSDSERVRLGSRLRPVDQPLVDEAVEHCRQAVDGDRFEKLFESGRVMSCGALPFPTIK